MDDPGAKLDRMVRRLRRLEYAVYAIGLAIGMAALTGMVSNSSAAPRTIVGDWKFAGGVCGRPVDTIRIGPMSLATDSMSCNFDTVRRDGSKVTWTGTCDGGDGPSSATVVAAERRGSLIVSVPGGSFPPVTRCG